MHSSTADLRRFAEKYRLAREIALREIPARGTCGLELEWNMVDADLHPLEWVSRDGNRRSFVDVLRQESIPGGLREKSQLEVFHWMIEWVTEPYYSAAGAIYEARVLEAALLNALGKAGRAGGQRLFAYPGNLLQVVAVDHESIPSGWHLAKRRYLERCIDLHGESLATAGIHANLSLPEPLLTADFLQLPASQRSVEHLDDFKSRVYVEATRVLRAFAPVFIATTASTPLKAEKRGEQSVTVLTEYDSVRNLTFPVPPSIDPPDLYRSYQDYLRCSYDLVRRGIRFGNNNWTPTRARSFAEPVERLIRTTSDQLHALFTEGQELSAEGPSREEVAREIEIQNLLARIDLPMARVEVRTDEGGHPLELDIANLSLKEMLLLRIHADPAYGRAFRYDAEDLARARRNEAEASRNGLRAELEDPFSGKPITARKFLGRTLHEVQPLAEALGRWEELAPLQAMADGAPNTAERIRARIRQEIGQEETVPQDLLRQMLEEREGEVRRDIARILCDVEGFEETEKLRRTLSLAQEEAERNPGMPIHFFRARTPPVATGPQDITAEVVELSKELIRIPTVSTIGWGGEGVEAIRRGMEYVRVFLDHAGLEVDFFGDGQYPAIVARFPGRPPGEVLLCGHLDVVDPEPDGSQFEARVEGDYLWGRGAADMKTVVATYMVWMKDQCRQGPPYPSISLVLVGNEEIGEVEAVGTPHVLAELKKSRGYVPNLLVAGERTGEEGNELVGKVCIENRGLVRMEIEARGRRAHTGIGRAGVDVGERIFAAYDQLRGIIGSHLTLEGEGGWQSQLLFPFAKIGERGLYNITPSHGVLGVEVRPIPGDDANVIVAAAETYCLNERLGLHVTSAENGFRCDPEHPQLVRLLDAVHEATGSEPVLGKKLPATSARFAPDGHAVVWGQTGVGPHSADERHFIPSILPYYRALQRLAESLR
jgi:acetylornithine deacetylase/succinyl-diaminopimelate desuccinylase-like protein